jgi:hypothetical protein
MTTKIKKLTPLEKRLKLIFKQLRGEVDEEVELIPEVAIKGTGIMYCYQPYDKIFIKIDRGIKAHVLDETLNYNEEILIYTFSGYIVRISADELDYTGFD